MTPGSQHPQEYIITDEQLQEVGEFARKFNRLDLSGLVMICHSRPHTSARSEQEILDEFRAIVAQLYDNGFRNPLATFDNARQILRQRRQNPGGPE